MSLAKVKRQLSKLKKEYAKTSHEITIYKEKNDLNPIEEKIYEESWNNQDDLKNIIKEKEAELGELKFYDFDSLSAYFESFNYEDINFTVFKENLFSVYEAFKKKNDEELFWKTFNDHLSQLDSKLLGLNEAIRKKNKTQNPKYSKNDRLNKSIEEISDTIQKFKNFKEKIIPKPIIKKPKKEYSFRDLIDTLDD